MKKQYICFFIIVAALPAFAGEHFDRAMELYKEGPSKAKEIMAELDLELQADPHNINAMILKAMVQMGTDDTKSALKTLDSASEEESREKTISSGIHYLRAKCLAWNGDFEGAKKQLEPFSAFFMGDPKSKAEYNELMAYIEAGIAKANLKKNSATDPK